MSRKLLLGVVAVLLAVGVLTATGSPAGASSTASPAVATVSHGCHTGYFCIYASTTTWNSGDPSYAFYTYGGHNIYGQYGSHWVFNRQTDYAWVFFCTGPDGSGTIDSSIQTPEYSHLWGLSPVNSILLEPRKYKGAGYVPASCAESMHNQFPQDY